ncbi:MAG: hypothetical protein ACTSRS_08365 [Candidatus Helarchaeota archaeon]
MSRDKTIEEIEAELEVMQKKIASETNYVKTLLKQRQKYSIDKIYAELFANIATLNTIIMAFQENQLDRMTYQSQLEFLLNEIREIFLLLKERRMDSKQFIKQEQIPEKFPGAYQKLKEKMVLL